MPPKRKPFSNKQKKVQLQLKNQRKKEKQPFGSSPPRETKQPPPSLGEGDDSNDDSSENESRVPTDHDHESLVSGARVIKKPHPQAVQTVIRRYDPNRFRLQFHQECKEDIEKRKLIAKTVPVSRLPEEELEVGIDDIYQPGSVLDIPQRPHWDYSMSKEEVEKREEEMFSQYVRNIFAKYSPHKLSYFELNLETWRQLWRVLEISDVLLMITDIRHPALHFSPALYKYVVEDLKKHIVLILNKVDLVPPQVVVAWKYYFTERFPGLPIACFSSFPNKDVSLDASTKVKFKLSKKGGFKTAIGPKELYDIIQPLYQDTNIDLLLWNEKLTSSNIDTKTTRTDETASSTPSASGTTAISSSCDDGGTKIITIGLLGHPNVGKSSLLNGLMEKKTVSTSRTPGHTKHFQTIFLTPSIRLCDCPGLVFPSLVSKQLQILSGMYPIAQVKEPYSVVGYLAQRIPIVELLSLVHPNHSPSDHTHQRGREIKWTPWDICDAWAERRGYYTRRGAKPDTYRAANDLLRLAADGRISLYFRPPGYHKTKAQWDNHSEVLDMIRLQTQGTLSSTDSDEGSSSQSTDHDSDDNGGSSSSDNIQITEHTKFSALMDLSDDND